MNQADMDLVAAVEAHIAAKDARIVELEREVRELESALRYVMSDADRGFGMPDAVKQTIASL